MARAVETTLRQPARFMFSDQLFYFFLLFAIASIIALPFRYIHYIIAISVIGYWLTRDAYVQWKWSKFFKTIPHPKPHWFMGHINLVTPDTLILRLKAFFDECGPIIGVWLPRGYAPMVSIQDADAFRAVMSTHNTPKGMTMRFFERGLSLLDPIGSGWLGTGLLTSNGDLWKSRRDVITPTFHFHVLQNYISIFQTRSQTLVERIDKMIGAAGDDFKSQKSFDIFPLCTDCTLDIIGACAFGLDLGCQTQPEPSRYVTAIREITGLVWKRIFHPLHQSPIFFALSPEGWKWRGLIKTVHQLPERLIRERKQFLEENPTALESKKKLDFLDMLLTVKDESGVGLSDLAIRNEVDTFLFEGHDTTASALSWTLYCLATNPAAQDRARAEVDEIMGDRSQVSYEEAKNQFDFLESCIKESLRLFPPVPFIVRNSEETLNLNGYEVPHGTDIILLIYAIQRSETYWKDPNTFNPDRFATDGIKHPFAYVPFSAGHRSCVGQVFALLEEKIILATLLRNFEFEFDNTTVVDPETYIILRPRHGVYLRMRRRNR